MKKILMMAAALACVTGAQAQIGAYQQGTPTQVEGYTLPRTVIDVTLVTEREVVLRGPYAKFASQYLGISAVPLSDKETYKIVDVSLGYYEEPDPAQTYHLNAPVTEQSKAFRWLTSATPENGTGASDADFKGGQVGNLAPFTDMGVTSLTSRLASEVSFGELAVNRSSAIEKSPEQMASEAAATIFQLRKRRIELVTGETGENVFGAGLQAALNEISRLENEYLSLFIGKRYTQRIVRRIPVLPQSGKNAVIVCRFSDTQGVVPDTDLAGRPIVLEMTAEKSGAAAGVDAAQAKKGVVSVRYRVPEMEIVKLIDGTTELAKARIPVFQFGQTVSAPVVF